MLSENHNKLKQNGENKTERSFPQENVHLVLSGF